MIGIIGAMDEEVEQIVEAMNIERVEEKAGMKFSCGSLNGSEVVIVRSGIGKDFKADAVINTGIAGSLDASIDIGDIVLSSDVLHHDVDATGFGYPLGQIPRMDTLSFEADKKLLATAEECCKAIAQAAYVNKIPFLIMRAISDKADDSATVDYPAFEAQAIKNSVTLLTAIAAKLG